MPYSFILSGSDGSERPITVPTKWIDLTLNQLQRLHREPNTPRLCILTDLTPEELSRIVEPDLLYFSNLLDFMSDRPLLAALLNSLITDVHG